MRRAVLAILTLTACGPVSQVGIGASNRGGGYLRGEVTITSDYLLGRDPVALYDTCVVRKTGQNPTRAYTSYPDRRG
jgi:hypothetical protein